RGRWRPRRDLRPRVRGGRTGARRRAGAHHRRQCPCARARRRARFSDAQPHDRRIPAGRVGRGVRAAYHARGVPRLRTLHHAGGTERRARSPRYGGTGDEGRRAGGRRYRPASALRRSERYLPRLGPPDTLTVSRSWVEAILAAGVVPASYVPEASVGRTDLEEFTGADPVEDPELRVHSLAGARPAGGADRSATGACHTRAAPRGAAALEARRRRVAGRGRGALRFTRAVRAPPRGRRRQKSRRRVLRGPGARARVDPARGPPHQRVPAEKPRRAPRNPLLVSPAVALGGERPLVRTAAGGSARASGNRRPSLRALGLAHHRTRAARDARPALGSVTLSYP